MRLDTPRIAARLATLTGAAAALLCGIAGTAAGAPAVPPTGTVLSAGVAGAITDSYIVMLEPEAVPSEELTAKYGGKVTADYPTVRGFHARMTAAQARRLAADPAVRYVEQDAVATPDASWGPDRIDQRALPLSKSYTAGSAANVTVYVIDSGIRTTHREFGGRARDGWDFVDRDARAGDCNGHGTHVAGTIGGATHGVAGDVRLVGVRVLDCKGKGSYSTIMAGIDWVTQHATLPAVANLSLGGTVSKAMDDAVNRAIAKGVTVVAAAGNDNRDACRQSPARTPAAITVGATDRTDTRASFSNYGSCLDLFAPGARIEAASSASDTATKLMSGTSMASPHVTGAAALVLGARPGSTPAQVRDELVGRAVTGAVRSPGAGSPNRFLYTGYLSGRPAVTSR